MNAELVKALVDLRGHPTPGHPQGVPWLRFAVERTVGAPLVGALRTGCQGSSESETHSASLRQGTHKGCPYGSQSNAL
jgi:hypothetical protein